MSTETYPAIPNDIEAVHDVFDLLRKAVSVAEMGWRLKVYNDNDSDVLKDAHHVVFEMLRDAKAKMLAWTEVAP